MTTNSYDVVIVGAGPSGSTLARKLALQNISVLLIDKATFPRYKVCGGGLTLRAAKQLDIDVRSVIRGEITAMELCTAGTLRRTFKPSSPMIYMVMRDEFDMLLLQAALDAGAQFRPGTKLLKLESEKNGFRVHTDAGDFHGRYLVGADGVNSIVAQQLNLMTRKEKTLALEYEVIVNEATLARYHGTVAIDYGYLNGGYAWVFPKRDHLSVGLGLGTRDGKFLQEKLKAYMEREQIVGEAVSEKGYFLSVGGSDPVIIKGRAALIGDAAGLVDPMMGEGIYYALRSANLLAEALVASLREAPDDPQPFVAYQNRVDREILREMRLFKRAAKSFHASPKLFHRVFVLRPQLVEQAFRVVAGEITFNDYYNRYHKLGRVIKAVANLFRV